MVLVCAPWLGSFAAEPIVPPAPPPEAICGFIAGPHYYYETERVKQGLSVDLLIGQEQINRPVRLRFFVNQKPKNFPVDKLQIEHEKFVHVIGVRDDLEEFFHVHPVRVSPGIWEAVYTFTHGGNYKIWTDLKYLGTSYSFGHPMLTLSGNLGSAPDARVPKDSVISAGYEISFSHPEPLEMGRTNQLQFSIRDSSGNAIETENFLGAAMHLVIVKDDLSVYLHAHPKPRRAGDTTIRFSQSFTKAGTYKLFVQFRPKNTNLPVDEAVLAEFYLTMAKTAPAVLDSVAEQPAPVAARQP